VRNRPLTALAIRYLARGGLHRPQRRSVLANSHRSPHRRAELMKLRGFGLTVRWLWGGVVGSSIGFEVDWSQHRVMLRYSDPGNVNRVDLPIQLQWTSVRNGPPRELLTTTKAMSL
jgi:hypothetical protein